MAPGELLSKLQVIVPPEESRGLCHLNPITLDVALRQTVRTETLLMGTESQQGLLKRTTLLRSSLHIWPVTLS